MPKISSILNTLFALVLLSVVAVMLVFGYRYFITLDDDSGSSVVKISENSTIPNESKSVITSIPEPDPTPAPQNAVQVAPQPSVKPPPKKQLISLYPDDSDKYPAFTTMEKNNGIVVYTPGPEWSEVISAAGVPVWIRGDMVKSIGNGYIEVINNRVNARSAPNTQTSAVIGSVVQGDVLKVSRKKDDWFRAWSPIRFRAWVKTEDLQSD